MDPAPGGDARAAAGLWGGAIHGRSEPMHLISRQEFPADPARVHAMVTDEDFLAHAAAELGSVDARVAATSARTAVEASVPSPSEIRAFIGPTLRIVQETTWAEPQTDGRRSGTVTITVPGAPVTLVGSALLAPTASGSEITYDGDLTVKVPLLGSRIEAQAAPTILEAFEAQGRVGRAWLRREG